MLIKDYQKKSPLTERICPPHLIALCFICQVVLLVEKCCVLCAANGEEYHNASHQFATPRVVTTPSYIVEAMSGDDVQAAIMFANHCDYRVSARSGGHSYMGSSSCDGSETPCIQLTSGT
jgi:hypothetical protein